MAFLKQLKLLLWKNGLAVIRQPFWSLTLIIWPLVIFIIIAVTRNRFPPVVKETCYVAPRNLPSTGVLPFLQTLMCNTDSTCHNKSRLVHQSASKSSRHKRSTRLENDLPLGKLFLDEDLLKFTESSDVKHDVENLRRFWHRTVGPSHHTRPKNDSLLRFINTINATHLEDQTLKESANLLKRAICFGILPIVNTTSPNAFADMVVTFCTTNNTLLDVSLVKLNQLLTEVMQTDPVKVATLAGATIMAFDKIQNETMLWETLLGIPQLFSSGSFDQALSSSEVLLTHTRSAMHLVQTSFPETSETLSMVNPVLDGGINLTRYIQNWPGKRVYISLGDVVTVNETLFDEVLRAALQSMMISLDQAIGLMLDKGMVYEQLCGEKSESVTVQAACVMGIAEKILNNVDQDKLAKQILLRWSKYVASQDVSFAKGLVYSLMGGLPSEGQEGSNVSISRARRSVYTQPQTIDEELFLELGQVVMDLVKTFPDVETFAQSVLNTALKSLQFTTKALKSANAIMENLLMDAAEIQMIYQMLLTNQSAASAGIGRVMNSAVESFWKLVSSSSLTCDELLDPFEWLLNTKSIKFEVWRSMICQNDTELVQALLMDWTELIEMAYEVYYTLTSTTDYNVTLPMVLSEWRELYNGSMQFGVFLNKLASELDEQYWMNWIPENSTRDLTETLHQSFYLFLVNFGESMQKAPLWPEVKDYFYMVNWILNYKPNITTAPPNCSIGPNTTIHCTSGFKWTQFIQALTQAVMSPSKETLVNCLKGSVAFLQHVYSDLYTSLAKSSLEQEIKGGDAFSGYLINLMMNLEDIVTNITYLPDQYINDPAVMQLLVGNLVQSVGLAPLLPVIYSKGPLNVSTVIDVASKLGRLNQHIFSFNESDPTMPELEQLMMKFLTLEGNLTMSLSHIMGHSLLTYSADIQPDKVAYLKKVIEPFTNQTSKGIVEALLTALELLKTATSPGANMTDVVLHYVVEVQKFASSLFRLHKSSRFVSATGNLSPVQVKDLSQQLMNVFNLLTPEKLQKLTEDEPTVALSTVFTMLITLLPDEVQLNATQFLQNFQDVLLKLSHCTDEQICLAGVSKTFEILDQIIDVMLNANGNVSMTLSLPNIDPGMQMYDNEITAAVFSLLLPQNDAASMRAVKQILHLIQLVIETPNVTVSSIQMALIESNLTIEDLNDFAALAGAANINELLLDVMEIAKVQQCYDTKIQTMGTAQCVMGLINRVSVFLTHLPVVRNNAGFVSLIPLIANKTITDILHMNFSSSPNKVLAHSLSSTLTNIKTGLQMNHLNTSEIMNEIQVLEGLIQLFIYTYPYDSMNSTLMEDPLYTQIVYLDIIQWYLKHLENITMNSSAAALLEPFFQIAQMQLTLQLAQTELSVFISKKVQFLIDNLQYPLDGSGIITTGQITVEILQRLSDVIFDNIEYQNALLGYTLCNETILSSTKQQVKLYILLIENWMKQPNVTSLLTNMLQWGNSSMSVSARITDLQYLLQMIPQFLSDTAIHSKGPLNVSTVIDVASKLGRLNQHMFSFNESNPPIPALEQLMMKFLTLEGNLTMSLSHIMGHSLLTYSADIQPDKVAYLKKLIEPITNQTSKGIVEALLTALELLKTPTSPGANMTDVVLHYLVEVQKFASSLFRLHKSSRFVSTTGNLSPVQVKDLSQQLMNVFNLLTPEKLQKLTEDEPTVALSTVFTMLITLLPDEVQLNATQFLQNFQDVLLKLSHCTDEQICLAGVSKTFEILDQIIDVMLNANGNVSMTLSLPNIDPGMQMYDNEITAAVFSLLLPQNDAASMRTVKQILHLIQLVIETPNVTVSSIQMALIESNLTIEDLNDFAALAGAANINELLLDVMEIAKVQQCYDTKIQTMGTAQCVMGLINRVSVFLTHLPVVRNNAGFVSLIPLIANKTITDILHMNFSSSPNKVLAHSLSSTLTNIKTGLQMNHLNTSEIMNEIQVLEGLIQLFIYTYPYDSMNSTLMEDPLYTQIVYLDIIQWYLKHLENITMNSSATALLEPFFQIAQMQLTLQLAQTELSVFISKKVQFLIDNLQYPLDGSGIITTGQITVEILQRLSGVIFDNIEYQNALLGYTLCNETILSSTKQQVQLYILLIENWMKQPNVTSLLTNMLQWGNSSMSVSARITDLQYLLQMIPQYLSKDQLIYISIVNNITQSLNQAISVAENTGNLQGEQFSAPILQAAQYVMNILSSATEPLSPHVQQMLLEILQDTITVISNPDLSFAQSRNISLLILRRTESVIRQIIPGMAADYLLYGVQVIITYFENISDGGGPDKWNELILDEMRVVESFLPPNSTEQAYVSTIFKVTHFILESGQGNMSLWAGLENLSEENLPEVFGQIVKIVNMLWPLVTSVTGSGPSTPATQGFPYVVEVLEQMVTGDADHDTWKKLGQMMESLLWMIKKTDSWEEIPPVIQMLEKIAKIQVMTTQAENEMIEDLQVPIFSLIKEIVEAVNGSHLNLSVLLESIQPAIIFTVEAAQQANGTLECSDVLKEWEPVGEAVGLSQATIAIWCSINLQPVLEAHAAAQTLYNHLNMTDVGVGPFSVSAMADRIVNIAQGLYHVNVNRTKLTNELFYTLFHLIPTVLDQPLSPDLFKQLEDTLLQQSLSTIRMLSKVLLSVAPFLDSYIHCLDAALVHFENNCDPDQVSSSIEEATMVFLSCSNLTLPEFSLLSGNVSELNAKSITNAVNEVLSLMITMNLFGHDAQMVLQNLQNLLDSTEVNNILEETVEVFVWFASTEEAGMDLLKETLDKLQSVLPPLLSLFANLNMSEEIPNGELFEDLSQNLIALLGQLLRTDFTFPSMDPQLGLVALGPNPSHDMTHVRQRRDTSLMMTTREPVDEFIDLFSLDYTTMFKAISTPPTQEEILETAHVLFANPDLGVVVKGLINEMGKNTTKEFPVDVVLATLSDLTLTNTFNRSTIDSLLNLISILPDEFPFDVIKNITKVLVYESPEILDSMQQAYGTTMQLLQMNLTDPRLKQHLEHLRSQVCALEKTESVSLLMSALALEPGQLCHTVLPILYESLLMNTTKLSDVVFLTLIGDPDNYKVHSNWTSVLSRSLNFNISSLSSLNITFSSPETLTVEEILRDQTAFVSDVQRHEALDSSTLEQLLDATLPNNIVEILFWLTKLNNCDTPSDSMNTKHKDTRLFKIICSLSAEKRYIISLLMLRHLNFEKFLYKTVLPEETQSQVGAILQMAEMLIQTLDRIFPALSQLQSYMRSAQDLRLAANEGFNSMSRGQTPTLSGRATFVTLSRALCRHGIVALLGVANLPASAETAPTSVDNPKKEEMIERFKIPRDASPFCMDMYLDMVNTTGGAIAWAFLKPMLMGHILYSPDNPVTRNIMKKANATLQEFADLQKNSQDWLDSSKYITTSSEVLRNTLPMLQNSLSNSFVRSFIEMQTDIDVGRMKETLSHFSNITLLLEEHKSILKQISTLSSLMVNLSSCIKFDRYRGYDSADQLNHEAQELAKNRDLYASVLFKLDGNSSSSVLPPKVSYTIRMHMDNVMRTDRVRTPFFIKDPHMVARITMRYNRGFIYLQENLDRAIIDTHTGQRVSEPAVQLQPFPYPCHLRDEYLEAISFVFPLMLMISWVLFVADFVKKLVYERELRLHEYMKMMGVNTLSHFCAWFLECAAYLMMTIFILTLVLKYGNILPNSDGFLIFLYFCDYGLSIIALSFLISSFFDKTYIAGLSGSLLYIVSFFPFIVVMAMESRLTFSQKSALSLFSPTCFSYASQYASRYESQGEGIHWSNSYISPIAGDTTSFGWLCWLMLIDSIIYFTIGGYIRMVFPGKYGIASPWYFPFQRSFWAKICCCITSKSNTNKGLFFTNLMQENQSVFPDRKGKGHSSLSSRVGEDFSMFPVGVALHGLTKTYRDQVAIENLNVSFYEGHVTSLLGHNGAGKTTTMSLLTGLFAPSSGTIEVYGRDMQANIDDVRKELGVCMQYDVLFDHMTTKEHLLLYGQIKAPHWSHGELHEQVNAILQETDMYAHRHKRVGTLSGGMRRKLSISIAFIGGSRLVVLDEPTTGVDPCSRRSIWDIVIHYKKNRTIIMSTHHLDEAEVLSDRIAFLERGGLKCCGSPFYLKDKLGQGYKITLTKKMLNSESERIDGAELKAFIQAHVPEARLKESQGGDLVYSLPPFTSTNASSYRSLLTALDSNLDALQLGGYGISDITLEEVFLQLTGENLYGKDGPLSISETISDSASIDSFPSDPSESSSAFGDYIKLSGPSSVRGIALVWQQLLAMLIKRFHHSRRDWKGLISQILLPVLFVVFAMGLGSIRSDLQHYPELELSPALYNIGPSHSFFRNQNSSSNPLVNAMTSFPGIDNACMDKSDSEVCRRSTNNWASTGNRSKQFRVCKCSQQEQICDHDNFRPPHKLIPSSQIVYNLSSIDTETYLIATANDFIRNRYGGFEFGMPLPSDLQLNIKAVDKNRTLSKVWFNPEGHHTMPAYLNGLNNLILRSNIPADKDPSKYAISASSHPYFGRPDNEDTILQGMLQILVAMCVLTGFSITTAGFAIYEVSEHHSGAKRLQHIAGVGEPLYWIVNFFYDMALYMIPVILTVAVVAAFQIPAFTDRQNLAAVTLLLVLFGFSTFPWMYLLSGVFKDAETAFITYVCINLFISTNTIVSTAVLHFISEIAQRNPEAILDIFNKMCQAFLIFPQFNFGHGLMQLARNNVEVQLLSGYGIDAYKDPFSTAALGWMFISSLIQGLVFFSLRLLLNKFLIRKVSRLIRGKKTVPNVTSEDMDDDVVAEHQRVSSGAATSDVLQVNQLSKVYENFRNKVHAVKKLSVGIPAGECFGLLGENGAGKTTTFKMLTGDVSPTDGTAQIRDRDGRLVDIMECRDKGINIGYCPQVDALDNLLTGEEHLYFYARIRGISKRQIDGSVNYLLKRLELNYHRNIVTESYSCGTRRKLSTALALIGHPQILLLDEPSSGMDPRTKRHLWKIISEEVKGKCAVVLTSHSMEECEALCSRLAIMVKGQFQCLGSLQHIKNRFGSGFTVKMYLAESSRDAEAITDFMQRRFPTTYLKDQHSAMVEYHVPFAPGGVADIFTQLESIKSTQGIKHFSVSQTTLDEVFINFAMGKIGTQTLPVDDDVYENLEHEKIIPT